MASITYVFAVRNSGTPATGLTPSWRHLKKLADNSDVSSPPAVVEIANGQYRVSYDAEVSGDAAGQIDAGAGIPSAADRYVDLVMTREPSKLLAGVPVAADGLDQVLVESGITPSAAVVDDAGAQLPAINLRQALAACLSALAAKLSGAATTAVSIKPAGKPAAADRVSATVDANGNRSAVTLRVPA